MSAELMKLKIIGLDQDFLNPASYRTLSDYAITNPTYKNTDLTRYQPSNLSQA